MNSQRKSDLKIYRHPLWFLSRFLFLFADRHNILKCEFTMQHFLKQYSDKYFQIHTHYVTFYAVFCRVTAFDRSSWVIWYSNSLILCSNGLHFREWCFTFWALKGANICNISVTNWCYLSASNTVRDKCNPLYRGRIWKN